MYIEASIAVSCRDFHVPRGNRVMSSKRINAKCHTLKSGEVASSFSLMELAVELQHDDSRGWLNDSLTAARTCPEVVWWENGCGLVEKHRKRKSGRRVVGEGEATLGWTWNFRRGAAAGLAITIHAWKARWLFGFGGGFLPNLRTSVQRRQRMLIATTSDDAIRINPACWTRLIVCCTGRVRCINGFV
jgi:hypothetical protein